MLEFQSAPSGIHRSARRLFFSHAPCRPQNNWRPFVCFASTGTRRRPTKSALIAVVQRLSVPDLLYTERAFTWLGGPVRDCQGFGARPPAFTAPALRVPRIAAAAAAALCQVVRRPPQGVRRCQTNRRPPAAAASLLPWRTRAMSMERLSLECAPPSCQRQHTPALEPCRAPNPSAVLGFRF